MRQRTSVWRAVALTGDTAKSRTGHQASFARRKEADTADALQNELALSLAHVFAAARKRAAKLGRVVVILGDNESPLL